MVESVGASFDIRRARSADAPAIADVHVSAWRQAYTGLLPEDFIASLNVDRSRRRWEALLAEADGVATEVRYLVAENAESAVVGVCTVGVSRDDDLAGLGELRMINIHPDWWGTGAAQVLLTAGEQHLSDMGFRDVYLWVLDGNERAQRFYVRRGWVKGEKWKIDNRMPSAPRELIYRRSV